MNRHKRRKALVVLVGLAVMWGVLVLLRLLTSWHDYEQVRRGSRPTFARQIWSASDGGTVVYRGLGYDLTAQNRFHVENGLPVGYDRGPLLEYWLNWLLLPLPEKEEIRFEPMESPPGRSGPPSLPATSQPVSSSDQRLQTGGEGRAILVILLKTGDGLIGPKASAGSSFWQSRHLPEALAEPPWGRGHLDP